MAASCISVASTWLQEISGDGAHLCRAHDDRVARHMAEAGGVALYARVEDLRDCSFATDRETTRVRAPAPFVTSISLDSVLIARRQELFVDLHLGIRAVGLALCIALRIVHAADPGWCP